MKFSDDARYPSHCAWHSLRGPLDWGIARRAVSCAGQNGCEKAVECCDHAQETFLSHGRALVRHVLGGEAPPPDGTRLPGRIVASE